MYFLFYFRYSDMTNVKNDAFYRIDVDVLTRQRPFIMDACRSIVNGFVNFFGADICIIEIF